MTAGLKGKKRVAFVVESGTDVRLVRGLHEAFHLTVFARRIPGGVAISQPFSEIEVVKAGPGRLGFALAAFIWLVRRERFDGILVQGYGLAALAINLFSIFTGAKVYQLVCSPTELYYLRRKDVEDANFPFHARFYFLIKLLARLNALFRSHYVVLSQHLAELVESHGVGRHRISKIPLYGIDLDRFTPSAEPKEKIRQRLGLPKEVCLVFFGSRIAPEKDVACLLSATKILLEESYPIVLLNLSGGYAEFLELATSMGVRDHVLAYNAVHPTEGLSDYYRACDVFVQSSREEGLGFAVLEAMACDVPVVAAHVGGLKETVVDGVTGWSYKAGHAQDLAAKIESVIACDEWTRASALANARENVSLNYESHSAFLRLRELIESQST